jgi:hypothetical protein
MRAAWLPTVRALCFLVPASLATSYTINCFYVRGAPLLDAGWFAWLDANALTWPIPNPPALGGAYLAIHFSPIFFVLTWLHRLIPTMPAPVYFAFTQGVWFGLIGLAAGLCVLPGLTSRRLPGLLLALVIAGNGITLATVGFPHFEIAIPALLLLTLALREAGPESRIGWLWPASLLLLLTIREDAGLHAATILGCLAAWRVVQSGRLRAGVADLVVATVCVLASSVVLGLQKFVVPDGGGSLAGTYLGTPWLAHVDRAFMVERLHYLFKDRSYVWGPLLLLAGAAIATRDLRLLVGAVACLPWLALSFVAKSVQAGEMWDYYSFPLMVGLCWPMLAARPGLHADAVVRRRYAVVQAIVSVLSIALFIGSGGNHDRRPWRSFPPLWAGRIQPTELAMDAMLRRRAAFGHLIVDDAVASLRLGAFGADEWRYALAYSDAEIAATDTLVYQPGTWIQRRKVAIIAMASLVNCYNLRSTYFVVCSRHAFDTTDGLLDPIGTDADLRPETRTTR